MSLFFSLLFILCVFSLVCVEADVCCADLPVGRLGRPEEIAETVLWMVNTAYVTNKVITVDGGMYPY